MACEETPFSSIIKDFISKNKLLSISYILLSLMYPLRNVVIPHMLGKLTTVFNDKEELRTVMFTIVFVVILVQIMSLLLDYIDIKIFPLIQKHIRDLLMHNIFDQNSSNFSEVESGHVVAQIIKFPYVAYGFMLSWSSTYIPTFLTIVAAALYICYKNVYVGVVFITLFSIIFITFYMSFSNCAPSSVDRDTSINDIYSRVDDTLKNLKTVLAFNEQTHEVDRINELHPKYAKLSTSSVMCSLNNKYLVMALFLYIVGFTCCVYFFKPNILGHRITLDKSTFISICIIYYGLIGVLEKVNDNFKESILRWGTIKNSLAMLTMCETNTNITSEQDTIDAPLSPIQTNGITLSNVTLAFKGRNIFDGLSVSFPNGKVSLVVGGIGAGKTTLMNLILKYYLPNKGSVYLDGISYRDLDIHKIRTKIAYLPQNPQLFNRTIFENIVFGLKNITKKQVLERIDLLGLNDFIQLFKDGLDENVGVNGSKLSGGQKQICWVIKISLMNPEIIILDEPTASLDPDTKAVIYTLLRTIMTDRTVIMVTHDEYLNQYADETYRLKNGKIFLDSK
jgi:subfamily B ATP-binding cassette protein MsbA